MANVVIEEPIDCKEAEDYNGLTPEDLEIFLRLPVPRDFRRLLYEQLKNAATEDRHGRLCGAPDEETTTGDGDGSQGSGRSSPSKASDGDSQ